MALAIDTLFGSGSVNPVSAGPSSGSVAVGNGSLPIITGGGFGSTLPGLIPGTVSQAVSSVTGGLFDLFSSRLIAVVLGLICITGAILLYLGDDIAGAVGVAKKAGAAVAA